MQIPASLYELKPASAAFYFKLEQTIQKWLPPERGFSFLLAVSGGADSTCLAVNMKLLAGRNNIHLYAVHVDHLLRKESCDDAEFVRELCSNLDIPLKLMRFDVQGFANKRKCGIEEAGHLVRKRIFFEVSREFQTDCIMLAHHADDLAEEILLRMLRGASWPGLGGLRMRSGLFFRPFLYFQKGEIIDFLKRENISWREDESNNSVEFKRNRIRHKIMPFLKTENPSFSRSVVNINRFAEIDEEYWDIKLRDFFSGISIQQNAAQMTLSLDRRKVANEPSAFRMRIYTYAIKNLMNDKKPGAHVRADTLFKLDQDIQKAAHKKIFQLPGAIEILLEREALIFKASKIIGS